MPALRSSLVPVSFGGEFHVLPAIWPRAVTLQSTVILMFIVLMIIFINLHPREDSGPMELIRWVKNQGHH